MKVKISKEVIRSDGWWRFACGDVLCGPARIPLKFIIDTGISTLPKMKMHFHPTTLWNNVKFYFYCPDILWYMEISTKEIEDSTQQSIIWLLALVDELLRPVRAICNYHPQTFSDYQWNLSAIINENFLQVSPSNFLQSSMKNFPKLSMKAFCNYQGKTFCNYHCQTFYNYQWKSFLNPPLQLQPSHRRRHPEQET